MKRLLLIGRSFFAVALIGLGIEHVIASRSCLARRPGVPSGLMAFSWFWIVHIPRTLVGVSDSIAVFEALAVAGIAWVLAGYRRHAEPEPGRS